MTGRALFVVGAVVMAALPPGTSAQLQEPPPVQVNDPSLCDGRTPTVVGTPEDDNGAMGRPILKGTPGPDVIAGLEGNDVIEGLEGDDALCGGAGDDILRGGLGADVLSSGAGNDRAYGGSELPPAVADDGPDVVRGNPGDDNLFGGQGAPNRMDGGAGTDYCGGAKQDAREECEGTFTAFNPLLHGFHFINAGYPHSIELDLSSFGLRNYVLNRDGYGLCGGFAYAAADTFYAGGAAPPEDELPAKGSALYDYLYERQKKSLTYAGAQVFKRFIFWQFLPNNDKKILGQRLIKGVKTRTRERFRRGIRPDLDDAKPVTIGILNPGRTPTKHHQVVAIGYFEAPNGEKVLALYDENIEPGAVYYKDGTKLPPEDGITWLFTRQRIETFDREGKFLVNSKRFRGYFDTYYTPRRPFWVG